MPRTMHPFNAIVGAKMRKRRLLLGMSQGQLGTLLGSTFQQVQCYESGANRIDAATLAALSQALRVPPHWFLDTEDGSHHGMGPAEPPQREGDGNLEGRQVLRLIRSFNRIKGVANRAKLVELVQAIADTGDLKGL